MKKSIFCKIITANNGKIWLAALCSMGILNCEAVTFGGLASTQSSSAGGQNSKITPATETTPKVAPMTRAKVKKSLELEDLKGNSRRGENVKANDVPLTDANRRYYPDITTQRLFSKNDKRFTDLDIKNYEIWYPVTYTEYLKEKKEGNTCVGKVVLTKDDIVGVLRGTTKMGGVSHNAGISYYDIVIPEEITTIEQDSFNINSCLDIMKRSTGNNYYSANYIVKSIVVPKNVVEIGEAAFIGFRSLKKVEILSEKVKELKKNSFAGCSMLPAITIPKSITNIGDLCFYYCNSLKEVNLKGEDITLGDSCFRNCRLSGEQISNILKKVKSIGDYCFAATAVSPVPAGMRTRYYYGLSAQQTTNSQFSITIPEHITKISKGCFEGRSDLNSVVIEADKIELEDSCFANCDLSQVNDILKKATKLGNRCFEGNKGIIQVTVPEDITNIPNSCFKNCVGLRTVNIQGQNVTLEDECFSGCSSLSEIIIPKNTKKIGNSCFANCANLVVANIGNINAEFGTGCFSNCPRLSVVLVPTAVGDENAFKQKLGLAHNVIIKVVPELFKKNEAISSDAKRTDPFEVEYKSNIKGGLEKIIGELNDINMSFPDSVYPSDKSLMSVKDVQSISDRITKLSEELANLKNLM